MSSSSSFQRKLTVVRHGDARLDPIDMGGAWSGRVNRVATPNINTTGVNWWPMQIAQAQIQAAQARIQALWAMLINFLHHQWQ